MYYTNKILYTFSDYILYIKDINMSQLHQKPNIKYIYFSLLSKPYIKFYHHQVSYACAQPSEIFQIKSMIYGKEKCTEKPIKIYQFYACSLTKKPKNININKTIK